MLREDEDLLRKILGKRFNLPKRENFMDFIKDAQEYLENDWYTGFQSSLPTHSGASFAWTSSTRV